MLAANQNKPIRICQNRCQRGLTTTETQSTTPLADVNVDTATEQSSPASSQGEAPKPRRASKSRDVEQLRALMSKAFPNDKAFVESWLEYKWKDDNLLKHALYDQVPSLPDSTNRLVLSNQQQLALIGDKMLEACYYVHNYPLPTSRSLAGPFSMLVTNSRLATIAHSVGLMKQLKSGGYMSATADSPKSVWTRKPATIVEAILGSVFMDADKDLNEFKRVLSNFFSRDEAERARGNVLDLEVVKTFRSVAAPHKLERSKIKSEHRKSRRDPQSQRKKAQTEESNGPVKTEAQAAEAPAPLP